MMRQVRQRCGFGCVICGCPIYEYDHILGWSKVQRHVAEEITLLCDKHHRAKTAGFMPNDVVIDANRRPHNVLQDISARYDLYYYGDTFQIELGAVTIAGEEGKHHGGCEAIRVDDQPLLWVKVEDKHLFLNLLVHDSGGKLALQISDNELVLNAKSWDIEVVGTRVIIREALRNMLFDIQFKPPGRVIVHRGRFLYNGIEILVTPDWCALLNMASVIQIRIINAWAGIMVDSPNGPPSVLHFLDVRRTNWDRDEAISIIRKHMSAFSRSEKVLVQLLRTAP